MKEYLRLTRTATYSFLAALPLLIAYEGLIQLANADRMRQIRVGADVWLKAVLTMISGGGHLALGGAVLVIGLVIFLRERKKSIKLKPQYFAYIVVESTIYAVVLAMIISSVVHHAFAPPAAMILPRMGIVQWLDNPMFWLQIALSIGAGLYEELLFRVLLVGGLIAVLDTLMEKRENAVATGIVIGAAIFSAAHHIGAYGDPFTLPVFTFRLLFGVALNLLYIWRGFGVAAWTHALYDIMVVLYTWG